MSRRHSPLTLAFATFCSVTFPIVFCRADGTLQERIHQLGVDEFRRRESATQSLVAAGKRAIPALEKVASSDDVEVARRAVMILSRLAESDDESTSKMALDALQSLKTSGKYRASAMAASALRRFHSRIESVAKKTLRSLGAVVAESGEVVQVESTWKGNDEDVKHLGALTNLRELTVSHSSVSDDGLLHLAGITSLKSLTLIDNPGITSKGIGHIAQLKALEVLSLSGENLGNDCVTSFHAMSSLMQLNIGGTSIDKIDALKSALPDLEVNLDSPKRKLRLRPRSSAIYDLLFKNKTRPR